MESASVSSYGYRWWFFLITVSVAVALLLTSSIRNSRKFELVFKRGRLYVMEGVFAPGGSRPYVPRSSKIAKAYRPFEFPRSMLGRKYKPRAIIGLAKMNRELFTLLRDGTEVGFRRGGVSRASALGLLRRIKELPALSRNARRWLSQAESRLWLADSRKALRVSRARLGGIQAQLKRLQAIPRYAKTAAAMDRKVKRILAAFDRPATPLLAPGTGRRLDPRVAAVVSRSVHSKTEELNNCYDQALARKPRLAGRLVIWLTLLPDGRVYKPWVIYSTVDDREVMDCLVGIYKTLKVPAGLVKDPTGVASPLSFRPPVKRPSSVPTSKPVLKGPAVPTLPKPAPVPVVKPVVPAPKPAVKPLVPAPKPAVKPVVPTPKPAVKPVVPAPKPAVKPVVPAPKPAVKPVVPTPKPAVKPVVPAPKPAVKSVVPAPKPVAKPLVKPLVKPVVPAPKPAVKPLVPEPKPAVKSVAPAPKPVAKPVVKPAVKLVVKPAIKKAATPLDSHLPKPAPATRPAAKAPSSKPVGR